MADLNDRISEPDQVEEFSLSDAELEDVDLDDTESVDAAQEAEAENIDPVFGDDEEVINDNLGYEE
ncbi:MAG: hypothetical protein Q7T71_01140 [Herbiconiux sp.]|nr:hypothetical protein [Herbiconiux sp.]